MPCFFIIRLKVELAKWRAHARRTSAYVSFGFARICRSRRRSSASVYALGRPDRGKDLPLLRNGSILRVYDIVEGVRFRLRAMDAFVWPLRACPLTAPRV